MKLTIFGATGALGSQCLAQAMAAGHEVTVLVRDQAKLPDAVKANIRIIEGDGLRPADVDAAIDADTQGILFAVGVDKQSPQNLCSDVTRHIFDAMKTKGLKRFVWCGGGSTLVAEDQVTFGAKIVEKIAAIFMSLRHNDKAQQYEFLSQRTDISWLGVRPLQMSGDEYRKNYRLGFDAFNGMSRISFPDCAHAMLVMLEDDTWLHKAPIIQY